MKTQFQIFVLLLILCTISQPALSQEGVYTWVEHVTGPLGETSKNMAVDLNGNTLWIVQANAESIISGETVEIGSGSNDMFLCKYGPEGDLLWKIAPLAEGALGEALNDVDVDSEGNAYVLIEVLGMNGVPWTLEFAGLSIVGQSQSEFFVVKLDSDGNGIWHIPFVIPGQPCITFPRTLVVDELDNIYFTCALLLGSVQVGNEQLTTMNGDMFVAMANSDGEIQWAHQFLGDGNEQWGNIDDSPGGGIVYSGYWFGDTLSLGDLFLVNPEPLQNLNSDRFIAKIQNTGEVSWLVREASPANDRESKICSKAGGGAISMAYLQSAITIGGETVNGGNLLLTGYSSTGELLWADSLTGSFGEMSNRNIMHAKSGDNSTYFLSARFNSEFVTIDGVNIPNSAGLIGTYDNILVRIDNNGDIIWYTVISGAEDEAITDFDQDPEGSLRVCGSFTSEFLTLGDHTLENAAMFSSDLYLAKLEFATNVQTLVSNGSLSVYPSPASSLLTIEAPVNNYESVKVFISDLNGKVVVQNVIPASNVYQVDVSTLQSGIYLIHFQSGNSRWGTKFSKE